MLVETYSILQLHLHILKVTNTFKKGCYSSIDIYFGNMIPGRPTSYLICFYFSYAIRALAYSIFS